MGGWSKEGHSATFCFYSSHERLVSSLMIASSFKVFLFWWMCAWCFPCVHERIEMLLCLIFILLWIFVSTFHLFTPPNKKTRPFGSLSFWPKTSLVEMISLLERRVQMAKSCSLAVASNARIIFFTQMVSRFGGVPQCSEEGAGNLSLEPINTPEEVPGLESGDSVCLTTTEVR